MTGDQIRPAKLAEAVAAYLEQLILEGSLRPGDRLLGERELAQRLNISRPSLRDGIALLEDRGLLSSDRNGTGITHPLRDLLCGRLLGPAGGRFGPTRDYLEFRSAAEGTIAYLAALRASDRDRQVLGHCLAAMEQAAAGDPADANWEILADREFHWALCEASHNVILLHVMTGLDEVMRRGLFYNRPELCQRSDMRRQLLGQHRKLFEAIVRGDGDMARSAAEAHVATLAATAQELESFDRSLEKSLRALLPEPPAQPVDEAAEAAPPPPRPAGQQTSRPGEPPFPFAGLMRATPRIAFDYLEFRHIVDGLAARLATERADEAAWSLIAAAFEDSRAATANPDPDPAREYESDRRFHFAIYDATRNAVIREVMNAVFIVLHGDGSDNLFSARNGARQFLARQHKTIFDAIMTCKPDKARRAAERHVHYIQEVLEECRLADWRASVSERRGERRHLVQPDSR